jgi:heat shock protein HtpX
MAQQPQSRAVPAHEAAPPPMDRLAESLVNLMRDGFTREIEDKRDAWAWRMLARDIDAHLARRWQTIAATEASKGDFAALVQGWNVELIRTFSDAIGKASTMSVGKTKYAETVGNLSDSCNAWGQLYGAARAGYWQHIALLWLSLWHGAAAGMKANKARALVIEPQGGLLGDGVLAVFAKSKSVLASMTAAIGEAQSESARKHQKAMAEHKIRLAEQAKEAIARTAKDMDAAVQQVRDVTAKPARTEAPVIRPTTKIGSSHQPLTLNAKRLSRSMIGTWLLLVLFSWLSLFWGALVSAPVGVGFGIALAAGLGIFIVPMWGTFFGFLGLGFATDSTLRQMEFKEVLGDHPLKETAARYARILEISTPKIGTIPACNAFAMGTDRNRGTVAMGQELMRRLTPDETAAVLGHEFGHIVSGDMRRMLFMRTFQNATVWFAMAQGLKQFARWCICWAAELYILAVSRHREYYADAIGAALAGKDAMIGALRKLEKAPPLTAAENTHARFMFRGRTSSLLSTHPSFADRIAALEQETYIKRLPLKNA